MNAVIYEFPENTNWRELYKAAVLELDSTQIPVRIASAKHAIVQRARELFQKTGANLEEKQALDAAMNLLQTLHSTLRLSRAQGQLNGEFDRLNAG
jgi:hypothetical protein